MFSSSQLEVEFGLDSNELQYLYYAERNHTFEGLNLLTNPFTDMKKCDAKIEEQLKIKIKNWVSVYVHAHQHHHVNEFNFDSPLNHFEEIVKRSVREANTPQGRLAAYALKELKLQFINNIHNIRTLFVIRYEEIMEKLQPKKLVHDQKQLDHIAAVTQQYDIVAIEPPIVKVPTATSEAKSVSTGYTELKDAGKSGSVIAGSMRTFLWKLKPPVTANDVSIKPEQQSDKYHKLS